jgi:diacylglycerol kinase family enzyme
VVAVLLNPASGATRAKLREEVEDLFHSAGIETQITVLADPRNIAKTVQSVLDTQPAAIVAGGGDGTVRTVASAVAGTATPLGVLPLGTLNHFAKDAGIPIDLAKAVEIIAAGHTRRVDVARVNDCIFINNSSIGFYPSLVESRERFRAQGHFKWPALALATAEVLRREGEVAISVEGEQARSVARTPFLFVGNNEYVAEGIKLGARTRLDAGRLYAYYAPPVRTRHLPKLFAQALFGVARREHALQSMSGRELWISTLLKRDINVACDGELVTLKTPLHYRSWPGALLVLAPAS